MQNSTSTTTTQVCWFSEVGIDDVDRVGGKNASLGEMYQQLDAKGVRVPNGFATTSDAYRQFLRANDLEPFIEEQLRDFDPDDVDDLHQRARAIRRAILGATLPDELLRAIAAAYQQLSRESGLDNVDVAVRSSATAEDLPEASFAGQQETFLMVHGETEVADAILRCFASLYTTRAVSYRHHMGIDDESVALSACVQRMVRADTGSSGVIFTLDTESGARNVVYVTSAWGLGENIVQGRVIPDSFYVHKDLLRSGFAPVVGRTRGAKEFTMAYDLESHKITNEPTDPEKAALLSISDEDVLQLARWSLIIEDHYTEVRSTPTPMDIEWAKDGVTGELFIVQARPETVHSQRPLHGLNTTYSLQESGHRLLEGLAIGERIASGTVRRIDSPSEMSLVQEGDVLVTEVTDPDWEPILKKAAALVTERGGRTSHAAIVARELGIPAIVGAGPITTELSDGQVVTVCCAEGETGVVYEGALPIHIVDIDLSTLPTVETNIYLNIGDPSIALKNAQLPVDGIGLARMEFLYAGHVGIHPLALTRLEQLPLETQRAVRRETAGYESPTEFLVDRLSQGIGLLAAAFWPRPVILRFSDFKSNEYATLLGGEMFEPVEENPMIGWRGASRYNHENFKDGFLLELEAVRRVRDQFGLKNLKVMVPFCRTPEEGQQVLDLMADNGLAKGSDGLEVYVMAEIPSNVFCAHEFAELFDGFSIGSNDLTQLVMGVDRDSEAVSHIFDERHDAVKRACAMLLATAAQSGTPVGICGQGPSDYPDFAAFLVSHGIDSVSVTPDALAKTLQAISDAEKQLTNEDPDPMPWAIHMLSS
jgi:pyruvate,water dikinase